MNAMLDSLASIIQRDGMRHLTYRTAQYITDELTPGPVSRTVQGVTAQFNVDDARYLGDFLDERDVVAQFLEDIRPDDVVYDVGANLGIYASFAGCVLEPAGIVVALEPNPSALPSLYQNVRRNTESFEVLSVGLSDSSDFGKVPAVFATGGDIHGQSGIQIPLFRGDDLNSSAQVPDPNIVKIDVEGAEVDVLHGFGDEMLSNMRVLYVEVHREKLQNFDSNEGEVRSILEDSFDTLSQVGENVRGTGEQVQLRAASADE